MQTVVNSLINASKRKLLDVYIRRLHLIKISMSGVSKTSVKGAFKTDLSKFLEKNTFYFY